MSMLRWRSNSISNLWKGIYRTSSIDNDPIYTITIYIVGLKNKRVKKKGTIEGESISRGIEGVNSRSIERTTIRQLSIVLHMCLHDPFRSRLIRWGSIKTNDINT